MKKLFAILLALAMIFAMSATAFAAEDLGTTTITVNTSNTDGVTRSYVGHMLLELESISLKADDQHTCNPGEGHNDSCYHYAFTVVDEYRAILQKEVWAEAGATFWGSTTKPDENKISDEQIVKYLETLTSDDTDGSFGTLRKVADRLYRDIKAAGIAPQTDEPFTTSVTITKGYWIFADQTPLNGTNNANSLVIVDTLAKDNITISPKTGLPTVTKKVQDFDDSEHVSIASRDWEDSADHDVGDQVPFKLTATLPSNIQYYTSYTLTFHDKLADALVLAATNRLNQTGSYKVFMYADQGLANADVDLNAGEDVTRLFTLNETPADANCTFEIIGDISELLAAHNIITPSTTFVVYYEATLVNNDQLVLGRTGNPNTVYLEYSNNPYDNTKTGKTETDKVTVFTYGITLNKVDQNNNPLAGAGFTLYKKFLNGAEVAVGGELGGELDPTRTAFTWTGLDDGDYVLKETTVPDGFNGMAPREFTIKAEHDANSEDPRLTYLGTTSYVGEVDTGMTTFSVANRSGSALPETGAEGTFFLIAGGTLLVMVAVVVMITRKKMSIYED